MSDYSFVSLRPFFRAALAKRWKVQFPQGFANLNNHVEKSSHEGKATEKAGDLKANMDKNSGSATGTRGIVVYASALENPGPGFES